MTIEIEYEAQKETALPYREIIQRVAEAALDDIECPFEAEISVLLTEDEEIRRMNREFRQIDRATDVLSFPLLEFERPGDFTHVEDEYEDCFNPESGELMLGDIVISMDKVREQAESYGHSEERELAFLVAHSMYHLFGFDHMNEAEAAVMERKQSDLLCSLHINR